MKIQNEMKVTLFGGVLILASLITILLQGFHVIALGFLGKNATGFSLVAGILIVVVILFRVLARFPY
jgi:hypothetical protein